MKAKILLTGCAVILAFVAFAAPQAALCAVMEDYCMRPPFVEGVIPPNLVLMIDNSASMYDAAYTISPPTCCATGTCTGTDALKCNAYCYDNSYKATGTCSVATTTNCIDDSDCASLTPSGQTCSPQYIGVFDQKKFYSSTGVAYVRVCSNNTAITCTSDSACTSPGKCVNYDTLTQSQFTEVANLPGTCEFKTSYLCVDTQATDPKVTQFVARGRFLNWLTASKMDIEKNILTGGKYIDKACSGHTTTACLTDTDCSTAKNPVWAANETCVDVANFMVSESRGCVGLRFAKEIPFASCSISKESCRVDNDCRTVSGNQQTCRQNPDWISVPAGSYLSFGVRGRFDDPQKASVCDSTYPECTTRIDIFKGSSDYNWEICQTAIQEWLTGGSFGTAKTDTYTCINTERTNVNTMPPFNHALQTCWTCGSPCTVAGIDKGVNGDVSRIKQACENVYKNMKPSAITHDNTSYVCTLDNTLVSFSGDTGGYVGKCAQSDAVNTTFLMNDAATDNCIAQELVDFCGTLNMPLVIDPSAVVTSTNHSGNVPAILIDSSLLGQMGLPIRTLHAKVAQSTAPANGVIQDFKDRIRFAIMTFNQYGAGTSAECSGLRTTYTTYNCASGAEKDSSSIVHYVSQNVTAPTVNDMNSLVSSVNNVRGLTWTPYAEGLYNAVAYYTQNTTDTSKPARINNSDFDKAPTQPNPVEYRCQKNNVLLISDGMSTTDQNSSVMSFVSGLSSLSGYPGGEVTTSASASYMSSPAFFGSKNLDDVAWYGRTQPLYNAGVDAGAKQISPVKTYVVYTGVPCAAKDASGNCTTTDESVPEKLMQVTAQKGGGTYQKADNPAQLKKAITRALLDVAAGVASGTAASVLASSTGQGANLLQAVFYPKRTSEDGVEVNWIGEMQNVWFLVDPFLKTNTIREDSPPKDKELDITKDKVIVFEFDPTDSRTKVMSSTATLNFEDFHNNLWEAGSQLWQRDLTASPRTIWSTTDGASLREFKVNDDAAANAFRTLLQADGTDDDTRKEHAKKIISYVHGVDVSGYRERKVKTGGVTNVWKLGDVVSSTPKVAASTPLNTYHLEPPGGYRDSSYAGFIASKNYLDRTLAFLGANDGMIHAFNFGKLRELNSGDLRARLEGANLGKEEWAFIPKNALPYLKYLTDPNYCHLYYIDTPTYLVDASIGVSDSSVCAAGTYADCPKKTTVDSNNLVDLTKTSWRTVLIGGMGLGGACKQASVSCPADLTGEGTADDKDCIKTPIDNVGFSSYFALDVTETVHDPSKPPTLIWEFPDPNRSDHADAFESDGASRLGFAVTSPAVTRIAAAGTAANTEKNGHWFVVVGSGPTGPIDKDHLQFLGRSDQNLRYFVLDLRSGALKATLQPSPAIQNAFSGALINAAIDADRWDRESTGFYQDDAVYVGYAKKSGTKWDAGGVLRIMTKEDRDPTKWEVTTLKDGIGPVTAAVTKLQDIRNNNLWLYFGSGRYFFRYENVVDAPGSSTDRQFLYAVKDPCYNVSSAGNLIDKTCTSSVTGALEDRTTTMTSTTTADPGWLVELNGPDTSTGSLHAERVITTPVAAFTGGVFFTAFAPSTEVCDFGGSTFIYGLDYQTGGRAPESALAGGALVQVSTGEIKQIKFEDAFKDASGNPIKKTVGIKGAPPFPAPPLVIVPPRPTDTNNRIIHVYEK